MTDKSEQKYSKEEQDAMYNSVAAIVKEETGIDINHTYPEVYVPAILKALKSLKKKACKCSKVGCK